MDDFDLIFFLKLDEIFGFAELGQCVLQQVCTFMRQEKLERYLKVEGQNHVPSGTIVGYLKLAIKKQETSPGPSCTESVRIRCELSRLDCSD